jgi:RNA polymerase sigma-70 factor (ECF subfamily)
MSLPTHQPYDEQELLSRIAADDEKAMHALFQAWFPKLCFYAESLIANREEAKDIAQEALLQLWHHRKRWAGQQKEKLAAYLFTVVRHDCYDYQKHRQVKRKKQQEIIATVQVIEEGVDVLLVHMEVLQKIYREIDNLPPHFAEIVKLSFIDGLTTQEIAEKLKLTPNHVRVQRSRALEKLRITLLKQHMLVPSCLLLYLL